MTRLGIDFGTSNTAAAVLVGGRPYVIPLDQGEPTLPTAVFFDASRKQTIYGHRAVASLIEGREGRFMRALKSVLGTPLMRERRLIGHERITLMEVVARFLTRVRTSAEEHCHQPFTTALSGRPVHFHSRDEARDAQAAVDLAECYVMAGFDDVRFLAEPEAAALACGGVDAGFGLVVDIGGGTSDFTVFRGTAGAIEVISSHGIRLGGTDFDRLISLAHVMPLLGYGSDLRNVFGNQVNRAPNALFHDLATWEKIPFQYSAEVRRNVAEMAKVAVDPLLWQRLASVLEDETGHDIAFAVERGKIGANSGEGVIDLRTVERGLSVPLTAAAMAVDLAENVQEIAEAAAKTVSDAGLAADAITKVVMVGGSSLLTVVGTSMTSLFPKAELERNDPFTAVVNGLAIGAGL